jgi:hypothetical protein
MALRGEEGGAQRDGGGEVGLELVDPEVEFRGDGGKTGVAAKSARRKGVGNALGERFAVHEFCAHGVLSRFRPTVGPCSGLVRAYGLLSVRADGRLCERTRTSYGPTRG